MPIETLQDAIDSNEKKCRIVLNTIKRAPKATAHDLKMLMHHYKNLRGLVEAQYTTLEAFIKEGRTIKGFPLLRRDGKI